MTRFERVRLRNGLGTVHPTDGTVLRPPDGETFGVAPGSRHGALLFHVVEGASTKGEVAVLSNDGRPLLFDEAAETIARRLLAAGFVTVAWVGLEARGAAVIDAFGDAPAVLDEAACAAWAVKALGGWDESELMTFLVTHVAGTGHEERAVRDATWTSVRGSFEHGAWTVESWRAHRGGWTTLLADIAASREGAHVSMVLADLDWTICYNDAYGHQAGDLMIARVHACIEAEAIAQNARFFRLAGEEFAILVEAPLSAAAAIAESIQQRIAVLDVPFAHPGVRTHGRVTVSIGVASVRELSTLPHTLEDAVDDAKRKGRNRITVCA